MTAGSPREHTAADFEVGQRVIIMAAAGPGATVIGYWVDPATRRTTVVVQANPDVVPECRDPRQLIHPSRPTAPGPVRVQCPASTNVSGVEYRCDMLPGHHVELGHRALVRNGVMVQWT